MAVPEVPVKPRRLERAGVRTLDAVDSLFYWLVGIAFLFAAGIALVYAAYNLVTTLINGMAATPSNAASSYLASVIATAVLGFVSDLLLVLIILEVLGTIRSYLDKHTNSVQPFLFIGIISATRGILSTGAHLSIALAAPTTSLQLTPAQFQTDIIQLGVNALVIIALGATLRIMGPYSKTDIESQ